VTCGISKKVPIGKCPCYLSSNLSIDLEYDNNT